VISQRPATTPVAPEEGVEGDHSAPSEREGVTSAQESERCLVLKLTCVTIYSQTVVRRMAKREDTLAVRLSQVWSVYAIHTTNADAG
jgi:hypothetical protein